MSSKSFTLSPPEYRSTPVVFASPHSGRNYTPTFLGQSVLSETDIRTSEDAFVDLLYREAPNAGAPLLAACAPRAFIDLNRAPDEFDPAVIDGAPPQRHNPRVASGLGVIPRVVSGSREIYSGKISMSEATNRVGTYWRPYHDKLQRLLDESLYYFGQAILVDCHSMPHEALAGLNHSGGSGVDVVLGDRYGATASANIVDQIEAAFASRGFRVARNVPFAGAYITQHYGRPSRNQHVVQVELDRALYMDEANIEPRADFDEFQTVISEIVHDISTIGRKQERVAAE